jgi:ElaB/YqjD/DUF883 family membrane-anchored ribosome-binding protein
MTTKTMHLKQALHANPRDQIMANLHLFIADAEELLSATDSQAGDGAASERARIQERIESVKEHLGDAESAIIQRTLQAAKYTDQCVHNHPWKAVGLSACVGALIGILIARG